MCTCPAPTGSEAAAHGHEAVVAALLEQGASANVQDEQGTSALHAAAYKGYVA